MLVSVARYLRTRLDPETVMVFSTPVPADALLLLGQGLVWDATYDDGRLIGCVTLSDLLKAGHLDIALAWFERKPDTTSPLYRRLQGETVSAEERSRLSFDDRCDLVAVDYARDAVDPDELVGLAALVDTDVEKLQELREVLAGKPGWTAPSGTGICELPPGTDPTVLSYIWSGDHAGCLKQLGEWVERLEAAPPSDTEWPDVAAMHRFLTGDDDAAMAYLERERFSDVRRDWKAIFGDARIVAEQQPVLEQVEAAFDGVPFPGPDHTSLYQAEAADNCSSCSQDKDHKGRWQDIPREQILDCQFAIFWLGAHSLPYYLPAIMHVADRERDEERDDHGPGMLFDILLSFLTFILDDKGLREKQRDRVRQMTPEQLAAIARFAEHYGASVDDVARWKHVATGGEWPALV